MSLIKWEPFEEFDKLFKEFGPLSTMRDSSAGFDLAVDVYEDGSNLVAEMNLPGLKGDDIDVEIESNHLRISGKREESNEKKDKDHYSKEIRRGSFQRIVALPQHVKANEIEAEYEDGVLKVIMPKEDEAPSNKIKVKVR